MARDSWTTGLNLLHVGWVGTTEQISVWSARFGAASSYEALSPCSIHQLGDQMPERWRMRQSQGHAAGDAPAPTEALQVVQATEPRDPRVPPVGTVLRRVFEGKAHEVTVCTEGFEYAGQRYKSLSAIATEIAGTRWNGFLFFGLKKRGESAREETAA